MKAGGLWLVLCPPFEQWQTLPNPAHKKLLSYPLNADTHCGHFLSFWLKQLTQQNVILLKDTQLQQPLQWPAPPTQTQVAAPYRTADQAQAVEAILHVVSGHRRRPLVLTADRGRGKSAALGLAAAKLAAAGKQVLLTAPSPQAALTAQQHYAHQTKANLTFMPFDEILRHKPQTDLLLVDEAAAIPTPVLQHLLQQYSRIVFATTEHGYEGTGRGFQLRFQQYLDAACPGWKKLHLQAPIRYQAADPLEALIFASFLLGPAPAIADIALQAPRTMVWFNSGDWQTQPDILQQVFRVLSLAHYQTQVKDLAAMLDNPQLKVLTLLQDKLVLGCVLISIEGSFSATLSQQIYKGERRVQGHLLAQSLAFHLAEPALAETALWRVMRIAVLPELQGQGIGTALLQHLGHQAQQQGVPYVGTSFGATLSLLRFWQQAGYSAVRLGISSDKASAEYSIVMLRAAQCEGGKIKQLQQQFSSCLYHSLPLYPMLDSALALLLVTPQQITLPKADTQQQIVLFLAGKRPFELVYPYLLQWFNQQRLNPANELHQLLCALLWQRYSWQRLSEAFNLPGKKAVINRLVTLISNSNPAN